MRTAISASQLERFTALANLTGSPVPYRIPLHHAIRAQGVCTQEVSDQSPRVRSKCVETGVGCSFVPSRVCATPSDGSQRPIVSSYRTRVRRSRGRPRVPGIFHQIFHVHYEPLDSAFDVGGGTDFQNFHFSAHVVGARALGNPLKAREGRWHVRFAASVPLTHGPGTRIGLSTRPEPYACARGISTPLCVAVACPADP